MEVELKCKNDVHQPWHRIRSCSKINFWCFYRHFKILNFSFFKFFTERNSSLRSTSFDLFWPLSVSIGHSHGMHLSRPQWCILQSTLMTDVIKSSGNDDEHRESAITDTAQETILSILKLKKKMHPRKRISITGNHQIFGKPTSIEREDTRYIYAF